jgi:hypothetical protein
LEGAGNQLVVALPLVDALLTGLERRFGHFFNVEHFQLAAVLHPQFKFNWLGKSEKDLKLRKTLISKVEVLLQDLTVPTNTKETTPTESHDFYASLRQSTEYQQPLSNGNIELTKYLNEKTTSDIQSLNSFPNLKTLFCKYNAGIPSSAAVERLFSLGGRVLTPTRTLLSDTHFEMIVFLKSNYSFLSSL